jgi:hypothetical protein
VGPGKTAEPVFSGGAAAASLEEEDEEHHDIHLPSPSIMPLIAALGMLVMAYAIVFSKPVVIVGALVTLLGFFGWVFEPGTEEH